MQVFSCQCTCFYQKNQQEQMAEKEIFQLLGVK